MSPGDAAGSETTPIAERFAVGAGRARPAFVPKSIHCPACGAGQSVKNEASRMAVCASCGTRLELLPHEVQVLEGGAPAEAPEMPFAIGDRLRFGELEAGDIVDGEVEYEVVARMVLDEVGEPPDQAMRQYLLFNPSRGSVWLAEWAGHYDIARPCHVMPVDSPFERAKGTPIATHDGRRWLAVESTAYRLAYVDGALPWVATVGDTFRHAETVAADGSGTIYEVERQGDELEAGFGRRLRRKEVEAASGKKLRRARGRLEDVAHTRAAYRWMLRAAALFVLVNGLLLLIGMALGREALDQYWSAEELAGEVLSEPFEVPRPGTVVKVKLRARELDNAWMAVDYALVHEEDTVLHVGDADIEYYHGTEGGERWREGSRSATHYVRLPESGSHRLLILAVSALGETPQATAARHGLRVEVTVGAVQRIFFGLMAIFSLVVLVAVAAKYHGWRNGDED